MKAQLTNHMVAMNPTVPSTRMGGKSFTVSIPFSFRMQKAVVLASAMVGMKKATLSEYSAMKSDLSASCCPNPA